MRKLALTTAITALAVMAITTSTAQAVVVRYDAAPVGDNDLTPDPLCPNLVVAGNAVAGGCHMSTPSGTAGQGTWGLAAGSWFADSCTAKFNIRVNSSGTFYAVNPVASCNLARRACKDDATGDVKPWIGYIGSPNDNTANMAMCIELDAGSDPAADAVSVVTFALTYGSGNKPRLTRMQQTAPTSPNWAGVANANFNVNSPATQAYFKSS